MGAVLAFKGLCHRDGQLLLELVYFSKKPFSERNLCWSGNLGRNWDWCCIARCLGLSDKKVVEYSAAAYENDTQFSAGLLALSGGESTVTFTFAGEDPKELNIQVLLK